MEIMENNASTDKCNTWGLFYKIAGVCAFISVAIIPVQIVVFLQSPPPETVRGFFELLETNLLLGLLSLDLLYLLNNILGLILFPALCLSLWRVNKSVALIGLVLGVVGSAAFFVSNTSLNMLHLYGKYAAAAPAEQGAFLAAGEAMLAIYSGTAYHMHYILGSLALLLLAFVMLRGRVYGKSTAVVGIVTNLVALGLYVPKVGVYISALSAIGYGIWYTIIGLKFFALAGQADREPGLA